MYVWVAHHFFKYYFTINLQNPISFSFAKLLYDILCKVTPHLSFPHKTSSLNLSSHSWNWASQNQIHLYVLYYCQGYFVVLLKLFQCFRHMQFSQLCKIFGSNWGFRTQTHMSSSTMSFRNLAINNFDLSSSSFMGSTIISICCVMLPSSTIILHLRKPSQRRGNSWSSAAIKTDSYYFVVMGTIVMFSQLSRKKVRSFWGLKHSQSYIRIPCTIKNALSHFWLLETQFSQLLVEFVA